MVPKVRYALLLVCACSTATATTSEPASRPVEADRTVAAGGAPEQVEPDPIDPEDVEPGGETTGGPQALAANGEPCLAGLECQSGICEGRGCSDDEPGTCVSPQRMCTRDYRPYCGCDGETFYGSGSCPGRRYAHEGRCEDGEPCPPNGSPDDDCPQP